MASKPYLDCTAFWEARACDAQPNLRLLQDGLFGWARSALMNGIKGVWARGQKNAENEPLDLPPPEGQFSFSSHS